MKLDKKSLSEFARNERVRYESTLKQFVEIPTVSADPDKLPDIKRMADAAAQLVRELGGEADILQTDGNPLVHGRFDVDPGAPTVTVYNHLDVQPASRETEPWNSDPFVFTRQGDRY